MTQQEWLRDWFHNHLLAGEYEDGQPDVFSRAFVAAYPSSPQGLATKALADELRACQQRLQSLLPHLQYQTVQTLWTNERLAVIEAILEVARKAGLTP